MDIGDTEKLPLSARLKAGTATMHEGVDVRIMSASPFQSRERYQRFLAVQCLFHRDIEALYDRPDLVRLFPDLSRRSRLDLVMQDIANLGGALPSVSDAPYFTHDSPLDLPEMAGWLYVAEGSNLGAAFLLKGTGPLGLNESFGARHLAAPPEGRGLSWRHFTTSLDALMLDPAEQEQVVAAARDAFARVRGLVDEFYPERPELSPAL